MLDRQQKSALKQLLSSPQWSILELLAKEICGNLQSESVVRETEWETLQNVLLREGRTRGINELIHEAYKSAQSNE